MNSRAGGSGTSRNSEHGSCSELTRLEREMEEIKKILKQHQPAKSETPRPLPEESMNLNPNVATQEQRLPQLESKYSELFAWPDHPKGREIHPDVSALFARIFDETKTLKEPLNYNIPKNCIIVAPPTLKHEIWNVREKEVHLWQRLISKSLIAQGHAASNLGLLFKPSVNLTDDQRVALEKAFEKVEIAARANFAMMHKLTEERFRNIVYSNKRNHEHDNIISPKRRYGSDTPNTTISKATKENVKHQKSGVTSATGIKLFQQ